MELKLNKRKTLGVLILIVILLFILYIKSRTSLPMPFGGGKFGGGGADGEW